MWMAEFFKLYFSTCRLEQGCQTLQLVHDNLNLLKILLTQANYNCKLQTKSNFLKVKIFFLIVILKFLFFRCLSLMHIFCSQF